MLIGLTGAEKERRELEKVLAACANAPKNAASPPGWAAFGRHVDDGMGISSSDALVAYLNAQMNLEWTIAK